MTRSKIRRSRPQGVPQDFIDSVLEQWSSGKSVRRRTPSGIRLHVDRPLPFLCLYRRPPDRPDPGTQRLVTGESAYLTSPGDVTLRKDLGRLILVFGKRIAESFGGFLLIEVWSADKENGSGDGQEPSSEPRFVIYARGHRALSPTVDALERALKKVRILKQSAKVDVIRRERWSPPGMVSPVSLARLGRLGGAVIGIEVRAVYRNDGDELFPVLLRNLKRQVSIAIKRAVYRYAVTRTSVLPPVSYRSLGQRVFARSISKIDERLADLERAFDFLLEVTPVNLEPAWGRFRRSRLERSPEFYYRPLPLDPVAAKRRLFSIPVDRIEEPTLARLFREKQLHIDRQLTMLLDRGTRRFLYGSLQMHGKVDQELLVLARSILETIPPSRNGHRTGRALGAEAFAQRAREEIALYRNGDAPFTSQVHIRDDIHAGLMVSRGNLLIGHKSRIPTRQVEAMLHHEIGTHALTYQNGRAQPFRQLAEGLPGYDELQEGLAVLSEYLCGGLTRSRMRLLAARVVAAHMVEESATFIDTFRVLHRQFGIAQRGAFTVASRAYRGGGLTKDAVYLRGLVSVIELIRNTKSLEYLFCGKVAAHHLPIVDELRLRGVLKPSPFRPRVLDEPDAAIRLQRLHEGATVLDLCEGRSR